MPEMNGIKGDSADNEKIYDAAGCYEPEDDEDDAEIRRLCRDAEGNITLYYDSKYDKNGKEIRRIFYNPDGSFYLYIDYEYDENGNKIRATRHSLGCTAKDDD